MLAAGFILSGCSRDVQDGQGKLRIVSFSADAGLNSTIVSRALDGLVAPAAEEFSLSISDGDGEPVGSWNDITEYPGQGYPLDPGTYTATALCGDVEDEGFGLPAFGATEPFTIMHDKTTQVPMIAKLLNMAVTVEYSELFKGYFPTHNVIITREGTELADFSTQPAGSIAYIKPLAFKAAVSYTDQHGRTGSKTFDVTNNIAACTHQRIILDLNEGAGGSVSITVTFNDEVETIVLDDIEAGDEPEETNP